jgi:M6 family metalloprotease-like protein
MEASPSQQAVSGTRCLPVLLGETPDRVGSHAPAVLAAQLFGSWPSGSLRDYYQQVSYGQFHLDGEVYGWFPLARDAAYYEGSVGCYGLCMYPGCAGGFVRELVAAADAAGIDWGRYDNDGPDGLPNSGDDDGYVDVVLVVHSGRGGECGAGNNIWSHSFFLAGWGIQPYTTRSVRTGGGRIRIDDYIIQPEISCRGGLIEIGVFCHEYGHALGLPDLHATTGAGAGIGCWGLMGTGCWGGDGLTPAQPVQMCAWSKSVLGWVEPEVVACDEVRDLTAVELAPSVLKIWSQGCPGPEYFLVENRQQTASDVRLPAAGLSIWHIDERIIQAGWPTNEVNGGPVYGVALEQADGWDNLSAGHNQGDAGDPWAAGADGSSFSGTTCPNSHDNGGKPTQVLLTDISCAGLMMSARISVGVGTLDTEPPQVVVLSPRDGENLALGTQAPIRWQATDDVAAQEVAILLTNPSAGRLTVTIYNLLGRRVRTLLDADMPAGSESVCWDGTDGSGRRAAAGAYYIQATRGSERALVRAALLK